MNNKVMANAILLSSADNVVVACEQIAAGSTIEIEGIVLTVQGDIGVGHKIARQDIDADEKILKYGAPIGHAVMAIPRGTHVHTHNIESDYLHSHTARQVAEEQS